jgi:hypothetical protein
VLRAAAWEPSPASISQAQSTSSASHACSLSNPGDEPFDATEELLATPLVAKHPERDGDQQRAERAEQGPGVVELVENGQDQNDEAQHEGNDGLKILQDESTNLGVQQPSHAHSVDAPSDGSGGRPAEPGLMDANW